LAASARWKYSRFTSGFIAATKKVASLQENFQQKAWGDAGSPSSFQRDRPIGPEMASKIETASKIENA
jgi:hypothetical protein